MAKSYISDSDRYNGLPTDNFDRELCLFHERCNQRSVGRDEKYLAFLIMLVGRSRAFYFHKLRGKMSPSKKCLSMFKVASLRQKSSGL